MKPFKTITLPRRDNPDLDDLLADDVTIAVMRADNVTPSDIRRLFGTLHQAARPARRPRPCRSLFHS